MLFQQGISDEEVMEVLDFADFDRRFELKINEASEDLIAKKEQGKFHVLVFLNLKFNPSCVLATDLLTPSLPTTIHIATYVSFFVCFRKLTFHTDNVGRISDRLFLVHLTGKSPLSLSN